MNASDVTIRPAEAADVPAIVRLLWDDEQGQARESVAEADADAYRAAFSRIEQDQNTELLVAQEADGGSVVGCLQLTVIPGLSYRGVMRALVEDVRVARHRRGGGIGALLLRHAEARAAERGCGLIELFVHAGRHDAHRFYERAGYGGAHRGFRKRLR